MSDLVYGRHPVAEALRAGVGVRRIMVAAGVRPAPVLDEIRKLAAGARIEISEVPREELDSVAGAKSHQGVVAEASPYRYSSFDELVRTPGPRLILCDSVTDPQNLGAVIRTVEAFDFTGVMLPRRRSAAVTSSVRRVSAGAAERIPVVQVGSAASTVSRLGKAGVTTIGLAVEASTSYDEADYPETGLCLVLGAEGRGLAPLTAERCDLLVSIPMKPGAASLNVAAATAVVAAEVARADRRRA